MAGVYRAIHRNARISARKVRPIADMIRGRFADEALEILKYQPQRGARLLEKVLQSALGNAQDADNPINSSGMPKLERLIVVEAAVDGGPMFRRMRPRARGSAYTVIKRFSHIRVKLAEM